VRDLREQIGRGQAAVVAGAGVTVAASGSARLAGWLGLLESALVWCEENVPGLSEAWPDLVRGLLDIGDVSSLLSAAELLTEKLGGREGGEYRRWLRQTVGSLPLVDQSVPEAILGLCVPVATTNYDRLIEGSSGWGSVTWRDGAGIQRVLRGDEGPVVHLHGFCDEPQSVVLWVCSYQQVLGAGAAKALQRAMASMRSLVFVGVGDGANDPNFGALRQWLARTFPGTEYRHFRLCLESKVKAQAAKHGRDERIVPIAYGREYGELAGFLRSLASTGAAGTGMLEVDVKAPPGASWLLARAVTLGRDAQLAELPANLLAEPPRRRWFWDRRGSARRTWRWRRCTIRRCRPATVADASGCAAKRRPDRRW